MVPPFLPRAWSPLEPSDFELLLLHADSEAPLEVAVAQPLLLWPTARSLEEHLTARPRSLQEHLLLQLAWPEDLPCLLFPDLWPGADRPSSLFLLLFLALFPLFLFLFLFVEEGEVRELEEALRRPDTPRCKPARL